MLSAAELLQKEVPLAKAKKSIVGIRRNILMDDDRTKEEISKITEEAKKVRRKIYRGTEEVRQAERARWDKIVANPELHNAVLVKRRTRQKEILSTPEGKLQLSLRRKKNRNPEKELARVRAWQAANVERRRKWEADYKAKKKAEKLAARLAAGKIINMPRNYVLRCAAKGCGKFLTKAQAAITDPQHPLCHRCAPCEERIAA